jgi:hypothetical protein
MKLTLSVQGHNNAIQIIVRATKDSEVSIMPPKEFLLHGVKLCLQDS